jgi:photosystem II stability/assembly factor-like uncharacterized protein/Leucine-rich repeat (LRR) protein
MKKAIFIIGIICFTGCFQSLLADSIPSLFINPDNTVTDVNTGLMWYQEITPSKVTWATAKSICADLTVSSYTNWRLPTAQELDNLIDKIDTTNNAIFFPYTSASIQLWTGNIFQGHAYTIVTVDTDTGLTTTISDMAIYYRAVRDANYDPSFIQMPTQGGEYKIGSQLNISWDKSSYTNTVDIELSRDGGKTYRMLLANTDRMPFNWIISPPASPNCQIRIVQNDHIHPVTIHTVGHFSIVDRNAPLISDIFSTSALPGELSYSINYTIENTDRGNLMVIARSSNLTVVTLEKIFLSDRRPVYTKIISYEDSQEGVFRIQATDTPGQSTITLDVYDSGLLSDQISFNFIVSNQRGALIHFFEQTSGNAWERNSNWNSDKSVCEWEGIVCDQNQHVIEINLQNNHLSGEIPVDFSNVRSIQILNLSNNNLFGNLPDNLYLLRSLKELYVNDNDFSGEIPELLFQFKHMETMYINNNQFQGEISSKISLMSNLVKLNVSNNQFTGHFADGITSLSNLTELNLSHNIFYGSIPESLSNLYQLQKLSIAGNLFEGNMPEYFQELISLASQQSDFRFNMLTAPNDDVAEFMSDKQIENDWQTFQTLPPTNFRALTVSNNMVSFSWEPSIYKATGGYEICCDKSNISNKCDTINNQAIVTYELWGLLPGSQYECRIRTITLPNDQNANKLLSRFSQTITVETQTAEDIWNIIEAPTHNWLNDVWENSTSRHYIVGEDGVILVYSESDWVSITSDNTQSLHSIYGLSENDIVAVGADGTILQCNGNQWKTQTPVVNTFLWGVWGTDNTYYVVGGDGTIVERINGIWQSIKIQTDNDLRDIWGDSKNNIFVVGQYGTIFHYNGSSWLEMETNTQEDLFCVWGFSENNVFAAGTNGTILHYNGTAWISMNSGVDNHLMDMWGKSPDNLYAVGTQGVVIHFDGINWIKIYSNTQNSLRGIWGVDKLIGSDLYSFNLYTVGYDGTILRFSTQMPTISTISDQKTNVNIPLKVNFSVESTMVSPEQLRVEAKSLTPALIPWDDEHLQLHGLGNRRELIITPARDQWGEAEIVITVHTPEGLTSSTSFKINVSSDPLIPASEREALLALYHQTNGNQWTVNDGWADKWGTECKWYGITCVTDKTYVEKIILPDNALSGSLPVTLSNLTYLTELDLHGNDLTGELPNSLGKLVKLKKIDFGNNQIDGNLPEEWGDLEKLLYLNLEHNKLEGSIPSTYGNIAYLKSLHLNSNLLCGIIPDEITDLDFMAYNQSNFHYNALYSNNNSVLTFMNHIQNDWYAHQSTIPEAVTITWTAYVITLNWNEDTNHSFEIFYSDRPDNNFSRFGLISGSSSRIGGLIPETTYYFKIRKIRAPHDKNTNTVYSDFAHISATTAPLSNKSSLWENGSFDENTFYPWKIQDLSSSVLFDVISAKIWTDPEFIQFFDIVESERNVMAVHAGIEGQGIVKMSQNVYIPAGGGMVSFDYRMGWNMSSSATLDRTFNAVITSENNDTPLQIHKIISTSSAKVNLDTGWQTKTFDVSSYACQTVRISFELNYPESVDCPMLLVLDNVKLLANYPNILEIQIPESVQEGNGVLNDAGLIKMPKALNQDISIHLISSDRLVMIPDQVIIPGGETQAEFNIVVSDDAYVSGQRYVTVSVDDPEWAACDKQLLLFDNDDIWQYVDNMTGNQDLNCIWGRSENDFFVLSDTQIIHFNGNSWETQYTQTNGYLHAIWGDSNHIFVVGDAGTILSYDNRQWHPEDTSVTDNLTGIWGNEDTIFVAGPYGILLKKTGDEWISQQSMISAGSMPVVLGGYGKSIYLISQSYVYEYTNADWTALSPPVMPSYKDIHGTPDNYPVLVCEDANILYTIKNNWTDLQLDLSTNFNATIGKDNAIYVAGDKGTILRSESSADGLTFIQMVSKVEENLNDLWALSENNVYAVGDNGTILRYSGPDVLGFQTAGNFVPDSILTVQNVISFPANVSAITLSVHLSERLTFKKKSDNQCGLAYKDHTLSFIWSNQFKSPLRLDYDLNVPKYIEDKITISAGLTYVIGNETLKKEMSPSIMVLKKNIMKYTLSIEVSPERTGNVSGGNLMCPALCRQDFDSSQNIQLQASPEPYYVFDKWTDQNNQTISSEAMLSLTITQDQTLYAIFRPNEAPLKPVINYPQNWKIYDTQTIYFELMPYSDPDNDPHVMTEWFMSRADRPYTCAGMFSSNCAEATSLYLTTYSRNDLIPNMQYVWKAAYSDKMSKKLVYSDLHRVTIGESTKIDPIEISSGLEQKDFKMISIPMWLENAQASVALQEALQTGYDTRYVKIGRFDPACNKYIQYNDAMLLLPGMAFWILSRNGLEIPVQGVHVTVREDFDVPLGFSEENGQGWNMIGSPTQMKYNWGQVIVIVYNDGEMIAERRTIAQWGSDNPYVNPNIFRWNNGAYEKTNSRGMIEPYRGYWVEAKHANVWLRFSVKAQVDTRKRSADQWGETSGITPPEPMQGFQEIGDISGGCFFSTIIP